MFFLGLTYVGFPLICFYVYPRVNQHLIHLNPMKSPWITMKSPLIHHFRVQKPSWKIPKIHQAAAWQLECAKRMRQAEAASIARPGGAWVWKWQAVSFLLIFISKNLTDNRKLTACHINLLLFNSVFCWTVWFITVHLFFEDTDASFPSASRRIDMILMDWGIISRHGRIVMDM